MAGNVNPQLPLPTPSAPDPFSILATFTAWANALVNALFSYGQRLNIVLPKDGSEAMTGALVLPADPTSALQAATKQYVDAAKTVAESYTDTQIAAIPNSSPKVRAHLAVAQSIPTNVFTKVTLDTVDFDTNSNFASSRFTPTVAGYYQVQAVTHIVSTTFVATGIVKNGAVVSQATGTAQGLSVSDVIFMNGTTDYLESWVFQGSGAALNTNIGSNLVYFSAIRIL